MVCGYFSGNANSCFETALTSGFVFKHDCNFKQVYGHGVIDAITADGCYYPWECWGIGAKVSYWRARGRTPFLGGCALVQQVPFTVYLRRRTTIKDCVDLYASLGGGFIWTKEKSYLGRVHSIKGIGEAEVGFSCPVGCSINIVGAVRYLFPRQSDCCNKVDVGGCDLRAGIGFSF